MGEQGWATRNGRGCHHFLSSLKTLLLSVPPFLACLNVSTTSHKVFRVCKNKVIRFLHYLKEHNPYYANVTVLRLENVNPLDDANIWPACL